MGNNYSQKDIDNLNIAELNKKKLETLGIEYCTIDDEEYPFELRQLPDRPAVLYYKGTIEILNRNRNIAVIGSRKCSKNGLDISYETGMFLAKNNVNVVNGLALGCDAAALQGAVSNGGNCVAIMPCGLDNIQPKSNIKLAETIVREGGCLLSEYPIDTVLKKYYYVERDRLQSGISQGVIIIEAEKDSGTMHTADFAIKQYKRLACYYYKLLECSSGNRYLQETGKAISIKNIQGLQEFVKDIKDDLRYKQLTLFD